jgi:hypothetical protein
MSQYQNDSLNNQSDYSKETPNQNKGVFDGGTYSDKPTTTRDVEENDDLEYGDHGTTTMSPTNDPVKSVNGQDLDSDDDEDFDDTVGEDNLADKDDGFNANSDDPTEQELTKTWLGGEKTVHEAGSPGMEGEPMGGQNFGVSETEQKNLRDQSDSETHSQGWGNSALQTPSEEISNPTSVEDDENDEPQKKVGDSDDQNGFYK